MLTRSLAQSHAKLTHCVSVKRERLGGFLIRAIEVGGKPFHKVCRLRLRRCQRVALSGNFFHRFFFLKQVRFELRAARLRVL